VAVIKVGAAMKVEQKENNIALKMLLRLLKQRLKKELFRAEELLYYELRKV
jgi:hypothetical protein